MRGGDGLFVGGGRGGQAGHSTLAALDSSPFVNGRRHPSHLRSPDSLGLMFKRIKSAPWKRWERWEARY